MPSFTSMPRLIVLMCGLLGALACGKGETNQADPAVVSPEAPGSEAAPGQDKATDEKQAKTAPAAYDIPAAVPKKERRAKYGTKKMRKAKKLNTKGYRARKAGDHDGAIKAYKEAIAMAPGYVTARYNLACEYALKKDADQAVAELEHLFAMGTQEALGRIAKLQVDADFDPIREDPRIQAITAHFGHDVDALIFKQLCENRGKMIGMMHPGGLHKLVDDVKNDQVIVKSTLVEGGKARTALNKALDAACHDGKLRTSDSDGSPIIGSDTILSKWTAKYPKRCVYLSGVIRPENVDPDDMDPHAGGMGGAICFVRQGEAWIIGAAGVYEVGGMDEDTKPGIDAAVAKAVRAWGK